MRYAQACAIMIITIRWHNLGMATSPDPISLDYGVWLAILEELCVFSIGLETQILHSNHNLTSIHG